MWSVEIVVVLVLTKLFKGSVTIYWLSSLDNPYDLLMVVIYNCIYYQ